MFGINISLKKSFQEIDSSLEFKVQAWLWLTVAILFEVGGTTFLKISYGLTKLIPSILTLTFYMLSFITLAFTLKRLEVSMAYAVWSGVGTALIAFIGIAYFGESFSLWKIISIVLIIAGVVGLNLARSIN